MANKLSISKTEIIEGVRCYEMGGTAYLNIEDVARGLGFTRVAASGNEVVRWERVQNYLKDFGVPACGHDDYVPENIFYRLAMKAKNDVAEMFQAKVADVIIPSIRKNGGYIAGQENLTPEQIVANALVVAQKIIEDQKTQLENANKKIAADAPLVDFASQVSQSADTIDMNEMAKLAAAEGINIGRNRLIKWLKNNNVLMSNNLPYQQYIDRGYFEVVETSKKTVYKDMLFSKTVVTGKGQIWLMDKIKNYYAEC